MIAIINKNEVFPKFAQEHNFVKAKYPHSKSNGQTSLAVNTSDSDKPL